MKNGIIALAVTACLAPMAANAQLKYNYVEGGLAFYPSAGQDQTWFGVDIRASAEFTPEFFAFGGFKFLTDDIDYTALHAGGAYKMAIEEGIDVWAGVSLEHQKVDLQFPRICIPDAGCFGGGSASDDDTSLGVRGGTRIMLNQQMEVAATARYILGDYDYLGLAGTARYRLNQDIVLLGEVDLMDGDIGVVAGATFFF